MTATWHDFSEKLTDEQRAEITWYENDQPDAKPAGLINIAQDMIRTNAAQLRYAHLPMPAGATGADNWQEWADGDWYRCFDVTTYREGRVVVYLGGHQGADGTITYTVDLERSEELTCDETRVLAGMLAQAAEKIDQLEGITPPFQ